MPISRVDTPRDQKRDPTEMLNGDVFGHALVEARDERDVVNTGDGVVLVGGRERGLHLARHGLSGRMAHEVADIRSRIWSDVKQLTGQRPRTRIAGHVAHRVAAPLAA